MKPTVLFFARGYQADFFPHLVSEKYNAIFVTLTRKEKQHVQKAGCKVAGCFEEDFAKLKPANVPANYLLSSFMADRFLGRFSYEKRMEILGKEISFWNGIFEEYHPSAVVNELVAIEISEVLLIECRKKNILYLAGMNCVAYDYFYWMKNPLSLSGKYFDDVKPSEASMSVAKAYIEEVLAKDYKPFYVKNLNSRRSLKTLFVSFAKLILWGLRSFKLKLTGGFKYELYVEEYSKKVSVFFKSLYRKYDRIEDIPANKEGLFFPLHQEPEATLNYMSEFYANQVATIENIMKCMTTDQVLFVKEHPVDKGSLLQKNFWDLKKKYSGLYFFPAELHGRELMKVSKRIITLTSTVGWEAIVTGKTVYVLGQIFYDNMEGLEKIKDFNSLKEILRKEPSRKRISLEYVTNFVASMTEQSYKGNPFPYVDLYSRQNIDKVIFSISDSVEKHLAKQTRVNHITVEHPV